jgi:hypothetical protein
LSWEQSIPIILGSFLYDIGQQDISGEQLAGMSPSRQTIENVLFEFAVKSAMLTRDSFEHGKILYTAFDKADATKGLQGGCVKIIIKINSICYTAIYFSSTAVLVRGDPRSEP